MSFGSSFVDIIRFNNDIMNGLSSVTVSVWVRPSTMTGNRCMFSVAHTNSQSNEFGFSTDIVAIKEIVVINKTG